MKEYFCPNESNVGASGKVLADPTLRDASNRPELSETERKEKLLQGARTVMEMHSSIYRAVDELVDKYQSFIPDIEFEKVSDVRCFKIGNRSKNSFVILLHELIISERMDFGMFMKVFSERRCTFLISSV